MASPRILVVDDNRANAKLLAFVLTGSGYEVEVARDAQEALDKLPEFEPALILMDLQMPGMDGLTLTRHLREDPRWERLVIVAVTAYAMVGDRERALEAGCDDYVTKPIDTRGLPLKIATYLEQASAGPGGAE